MGMVTFLTILVLISALVALVTGVSALRAGLRLSRTSQALRTHLYSEIDRLARRSTELEKSLAAVNARAQALPVRVSELQQNLAALRVLTSALGTSLRRSRRALSSVGTKSSRDDENDGLIRREREDESPEP
jgi:septal ring factor EnvC (AmiA/AmiB activator)